MRDREIDEARSACREVAGNRDWKDVSTQVDGSNDNRVDITVKGKRHGEERERQCRYHIKDHNAEFDDQG